MSTPTPTPLAQNNAVDAAPLWDLAERLADAARPVSLKYFRAPDLSHASKGTYFDPVTAADHAVEDIIRSLLAAERPLDGIFGEERGQSAGRSGLTWVIDPIDGTRSYLAGTPTWTVLIGLVDAKGPVLGLIDQPFLGERFCGGLGRAEYLGPLGRRVLQTRNGRPLERAILFSTFPEIGTKAERAAFLRVAERVQLVRYGLDAYAYALLAAGHIDLVIEAGLEAYDVVAPAAVIEAAGGIVTDWTGGPVHRGGRVLAAANTELHAAALALLNWREEG